jgi:hypothetical protein
MTVLGGYVRHRDRMVQASVIDDLQNTLIACRWKAGTTSRQVVSPYNVGAGLQTVTTAPNQVLKLLGSDPINVIDYFPESKEQARLAGLPESGKTPLNTLAVDQGRPAEPESIELGSSMMEQGYAFALAFYAASDAAAVALLNDLRDRYKGKIVRDDAIELFDYNNDATTPVVRMDVNGFVYAREVEQVAPQEVHLFYGELTLSDYVD